MFVVPPGLLPPIPWRVLEKEVFSLASGIGVLPEISNSNTVSVKKVYAAKLVANFVQLVAVTDRTTNVRKVCTVVLAWTGSTIDGMDLERP